MFIALRGHALLEVVGVEPLEDGLIALLINPFVLLSLLLGSFLHYLEELENVSIDSSFSRFVKCHGIGVKNLLTASSSAAH